MRWIIAAVVIVMVHAAAVALLVTDFSRVPDKPITIAAIAVTLAPVEASSPSQQDQDVAIGPAMQQTDAVPQEQPKTQEKPVEQVAKAPPLEQADVALPREEPKAVEKPQETPQPPVPETLAPPKTDRIGQFTEASSNAYNALVFGHLQRFKRYPREARGASGTTVVKFVLTRAGEVAESEVTKSSGNAVLDREALEILKRASPFPAFPTVKPGERDIYIAPVSFGRKM
ncbi:MULTISPECIES: energy transducer TonB [unclassified Beijerinckia]|uniref:energy transducer TonB n=1 Tax=unclassified Beijerinckia TaxID=2638183 RepID=UPI0014803F3B|nr:MULTISPECIES: energy transducer TonB [unclassified Beijerinckia]